MILTFLIQIAVKIGLVNMKAMRPLHFQDYTELFQASMSSILNSTSHLQELIKLSISLTPKHKNDSLLFNPPLKNYCLVKLKTMNTCKLKTKE